MSTKKQVRVLWKYAGLMDYLRGLMQTYQRLENLADIIPVINPEHRFAPVFDWSRSDLWTTNIDIDLNTGNTDQSWKPVYRLLSTSNIINLVCTGTPNYSDVSRFKWLLKPKEEILQQIKPRVSKLVFGDYYVYHVRLGDSYFQHGKSKSELLTLAAQKLNEIARPNDYLTYLLTDSPDLYDLLPDTFLKTGSVPKHSGSQGGYLTYDAVLDIFTDIEVLINSKMCICVTALPWGRSGFSNLPCSVYGVPWTAVKI